MTKKYLHILFAALALAGGVRAQSDDIDTTASEDQKPVVMRGTYYSDRFVGRKTASGDVFRQNRYTAAHKTIPFGTYLRVTNPLTNCVVVVRVNDRCPKRNVLDMTKLAVFMLGIKGSRPVEVEMLDDDMGYALWVAQDTNAITAEDYLSFKDRVKKKPPEVKKQNAHVAPVEVPEKTVVRPSDNNSSLENPDKNNQQQKTDTVRKVDTTSETPPLEEQELSEPQNDSEPRYDLELGVVSSHQSADRVVRRLPQQYQDKVVVRKETASRQMHVILEIRETRSGAIKIQSILFDDFPESNLVPHQATENSVEN